MKYLSLKILVLCILTPPVLYIFSVLLIEKHLQSIYTEELEGNYTGNTQALLSGNKNLKDTINNEVTAFLESKLLIWWGVKVTITVITKTGSLLYPGPIEEAGSVIMHSEEPMKVAAENFKFMSEGIVFDLDINLDHNTLLSNILLGFYMLCSISVMSGYYRSGLRKARKAELDTSEEIERLKYLDKEYALKLKSLEEQRQNLTTKFEGAKDELKDARQKASRNEDEMLDEIVTLEEELNKNLDLQNKQQKEIEALTLRIAELEKGGRKTGANPEKGSAAVNKRFKTLYKAISIHKRAVNGFLELSDDMKIKGEEVIHMLNTDPAKMSIKRKVFSRKSQETILEVRFAYKGRLYFRKTRDKNIEILAIGSKNTQTKDFEFLGTV